MDTFEYTWVDLKSSELREPMKEYGLRGWEAFHVEYPDVMGYRRNFTIWFKRKITKEEEN